MNTGQAIHISNISCLGARAKTDQGLSKLKVLLLHCSKGHLHISLGFALHRNTNCNTAESIGEI